MEGLKIEESLLLKLKERKRERKEDVRGSYYRDTTISAPGWSTFSMSLR